MDNAIDLTFFQDRPITRSSMKEFAAEIAEKVDNPSVTEFKLVVMEGEDSVVFEITKALESE